MQSPATAPKSDFDFFSPSRSRKFDASHASSVVVKTRTLIRPVLARPTAMKARPAHPPTSSPPSSLASSPRSSPSHTSRKRKSEPSGSGVDYPLSREGKRCRASTEKAPKQTLARRRSKASSNASSRASSRQGTRASSPEPIYRNSRSRSTSIFPARPSPPPQTRQWRTEEDGDPTCHYLSSEMVVKKLIKSYKAYFRNPDTPDDKSFEPENLPVVELEYPNTHACEKYLLLAPKDKDHYNPIMDLEQSLYTMIDCYLTKDQQALFGPIPEDDSEDDTPPSSPYPFPQPPSSPSSTSSVGFHEPVAESSSSPAPLPSPAATPTEPPLLRALQRSIHTQNGPLFLRTLASINAILRELKSGENEMMRAVSNWTHTGLPKKVLMRIIDENYQRTVGPNVPSLKRYTAFSSTVYGELMPSLAHDIIQICNLREGSLFLDLGSGVGNVVVQASLQTGCRSYGVELMPHPARVADDVGQQIRIRSRMWGVRIGDIELEHGDMLKSARVPVLMPQADVVLVDNKVFEESLNAAIRPMFLDLKEGAIVVSLAPFVKPNARVTMRNVDDISAIFDVEEREYHSGSVSWGNNGGTYYIHRVDREGYAKIKEKFESAHNGRTMRTRR